MKHWKLACATLLVFALGMLTGALIASGVFKWRVGQIALDDTRLKEAVMQRLSGKLSLDARQRREIDGIVDKAIARINQARQQIRPQIVDALEEAEAEIRPKLSAGQEREFDEIVRRVRRGVLTPAP